jgi:glyoxylase-like metal-dependent hydrolase (beta-lactamase superfamily II)
MKFADDIYVYEWKNYYANNCNSFYIGGNVGALIDPGLLDFLPDLLEQMEQDGISKSDIRYIINTHSHPDHYEGSVHFNDFDVKIALHEKETEFMKEGGASIYRLFGITTPEVKINLVLSEGKITLGNETFEILLIPGHSPGSIGLYWPDRKALFSGDVIFYQNVGRSDFPGGSGHVLKQSITALSLLDVDMLFPGHMNMIAGTDRVQKNFEMVKQHVFPYIGK